MKKNTLILLSAVLLTLVALILILTQKRSTFKKSMCDFAVKDTSSVTKIFMADKNNNTLLLKRMEPGKWLVNNKYPAQKQLMDILLKTLKCLEVRRPVPLSAHNTIIREMAVNSVKVEIYQLVYRVDLFDRFRLWPYEKLTKVYYVGGATPDNQGSFMLMEDSSEPFVTFLPGLRGFVSPRYTPIEKYWRDYNVFRKTIPEISVIRMDFPSNPEYSYEVRNEGMNRITLISLIDNQPVLNYDTLKILNFLSGFRNLNFEAILNDMDPVRKDSILRSTPFIRISVSDTGGNTRTIQVFHKPNTPGQTDMEGKRLPYDPDRLYALVNEGQDFTLIQYFVFSKVLRPKFFFCKDQKPLK